MKIVNSYVNNSDIAEITKKNNTADFNQILNDEIEKNEKKSLTFSKHANIRLNSRDIQLSNEQISRVQKGLSAAGSKGINETLILVDDIALLVSAKNKVVVTALKDNKNRVFTNIQGAVIV